MVVGRNAASNPSDAIFRRGVSDSAAIRRYNSKEDDEKVAADKRDASDKSSYGDAFFVVDMENDLCEEVSYLSDPMLTTPLHRGRTVKHKQPFSAAHKNHHGKRRLSATSLLKKPIAALVKHNYFGSHQKKNLHEKQFQRRSKKSSKVSPVVEDTSKASPSSNNQEERVPLTLMVPLGGEDVTNNNNNNYGTYDENRNPRSSPDQPHYMHSRNQPSPPTALQLYQDPTLSWEDDRLLLFDDSTPRTPLGLGAASFQRQTKRTSSSSSPVKIQPKIDEENTGTSTTAQLAAKPLQSMLCCRSSPVGTAAPQDRRTIVAQMLVNRWEIVSLIVSVVLLILAVALGVSPVADDNNSFVDLVFWAVTSFTTVGPVNAWKDDDASLSISLMLMSVLYALLGITTLGVVWGRYGRILVQETETRKTLQQDSLQRHALSVFCGPPSHRGSLTTGKKSSPRPQSKSFVWKGVGIAATMLVLTVLLGMTLDGGIGHALYYAMVTACTLGDSGMATQSSMSKLLLLMMISLSIVGMLRWMTTIASWVAKNREKNSRPEINATEMMGMLETLQLEDGLLTRADFLEILLLSMKKVDPELIFSLREGFQKATHSGSVDLTRAQLVESTMSGLSINANQ
ncbi:MAG: hypothetical protein SGARI_001991 [Bacillariaceae sp.]